MRDDEQAGLTPEERALLDALPRDRQPPPGLESRVVGALHDHGLLRPAGAWRRLAAVAAAFIFAVPSAYLYGVRVGARGAAQEIATPARQPTFALMVFDPVVDVPPQQVETAVAEARQWAEELAAAGRLVSAEKLRDQGGRLVQRGGEVQLVADFPPPGDTLVLGGFFMIRAADYAEAQRIAAACPLLRYGSTIEVRAFDDG